MSDLIERTLYTIGAIWAATWIVCAALAVTARAWRRWQQ